MHDGPEQGSAGQDHLDQRCLVIQKVFSPLKTKLRANQASLFVPPANVAILTVSHPFASHSYVSFELAYG